MGRPRKNPNPPESEPKKEETEERPEAEGQDEIAKAAQAQLAQAEAAADASGAGEEAPRKRGRPKGSVGRPKKDKFTFDGLPAEMVNFAADAPYMGIDAICRFGAGIEVQFNDKCVEMTRKAMNHWIASKNWNIAPGWALVACYGITAMTAIPSIMAGLEAKKAKGNTNARGTAGQSESGGTPPAP